MTCSGQVVKNDRRRDEFEFLEAMSRYREHRSPEGNFHTLYDKSCTVKFGSMLVSNT